MIDSLGYRLKQLRQERKLKQGQVADIIGVNKRQISAYENDSRQPSYDILIRLAVLYHVNDAFCFELRDALVWSTLSFGISGVK